jgi:hypothetical protein
MSRPIVVLGMHRGGTSLIADLIRRWGAYAGHESKLLPADKNNQQGYWEYIPLISFNDNLLNSIGSTWLVPPGSEAEETLRARASEIVYKHPAEQLVKEMQAGGEHWFWKDPRLTVLLPFWERIWDQAIYVVAVRHPLEVAMSLKKRDHLPVSASLLIWQQYMLQCLRHTEDSKQRIFIRYEKLIQSPLEACTRLSAFLDNLCGRESIDPRVLDKMTAAVKAGLRHNNSRLPFSEEPRATAQQKLLNQILNERAEDRTGPIEQAKIALYPGWKEYLQTFAALSKLWQFRGQEQLVLSQTSRAHREVFGL